MVEYLEEKIVQTTLARFGHLSVTEGRAYSMPTTAPEPRTEGEAKATLLLAQQGADIPVLVMPLARVRAIKGHLGPLANDKRSLITEGLADEKRPLILSDLESEALSFGCYARALFQEEKNLPEAVRLLLSSSLKSDAKSGHEEAGRVWQQTLSQYGPAPLRQWYESLQERAGSPVFLSPTPIIRASVASVDQAFSIGWGLADTVEKSSFRGRGMHQLIHSEVFQQNPQGMVARRRILDALRSMGSPTGRRAEPRIAPFVSMKVIDRNGYLTNGPGDKVARQLLRDFLIESCEYVRAAKGVMILHDFGTWALAPLDCGVDIVSFRCDARKFYIDPIWGVEGASAPKQTPPPAPAKHRHRTLPPFHPDELCDGHIKDFKKLWRDTKAFPTAEYVSPQPWWTFNRTRQREYRAQQVIGSLLQVGRQFRVAAHGQLPLGESVRGRVARMKEQDALLDLCPSL